MDKIVKHVILDKKKYTIIGCSVMGEDKLENQDSFDIYSDEKQIIAVVADGLGSASYSKEGSSKIVKICLEQLKDSLLVKENFGEKLFKVWKESVSGKLTLYDTTVKFVKITKDKICYGGIGDGWLSLKCYDKFINLVVEKEFLNQTDSMLSYNLSTKFIFEEIDNKGMDIIVIATDGFSDDVDKKEDFLKDVKKDIDRNLDSFVEELKETLQMWPITSNKDDKTIIIISKGSE